jgi:hypothetical protein
MNEDAPSTHTVDPTKAALLQTLRAQRHHVLGALDGLDAAALRRAVLPSGWSCLGLVQHLALDVERFWFPMTMAGQSVEDQWAGALEAAWTVAPEHSAEAVLALYRAESQRADAVIARLPLDAEPLAWPDDQFGDYRLTDLRAVLLHVIVETACHAGHLDAARELLDGRSWLIVD